MNYPLHMQAIDMQWSEIRDHEYNVICEVKARYADEVFAILNAAQQSVQSDMAKPCAVCEQDTYSTSAGNCCICNTPRS